MSPDIFHNIHDKLSINFPEFDWNSIDLDWYLDLLSKDKKNVGDNVGCILAKDSGILFKEQLPRDDKFRELINIYFSEQDPNRK
jgi:3-dehydroquinate synthase